jgi:hypothetical protein
VRFLIWQYSARHRSRGGNVVVEGRENLSHHGSGKLAASHSFERVAKPYHQEVRANYRWFRARYYRRCK